MLETVVKEKPIAGAPPTKTSPQSPKPDNSTTSSSPPPNQPIHKSANERLRSMFRRSSAVPTPPDSAASPVSSPVAEKPPSSPIPLTGKPMQEEPINGFASHSQTPPPIPDKLTSGDSIVRSLTPGSPGPLSPSLDGRPRSPRVLEKALPVPVPVLDEEGNIVDHPDSPRPSGEGRNLEDEVDT